MKNWLDLKQILVQQNIPEQDIKLTKEFLETLSFDRRQQMMGIFLGWPEKLGFFVDLLKKKKKLAKNYQPELARKILDLEKKEVQDLIKELS
ncbi:hypothetical protein KJ853_01260 [Patescibacteria group bacterium]|nr:hypothetical protein [Patescibacteria group bacterium]